MESSVKVKREGRLGDVGKGEKIRILCIRMVLGVVTQGIHSWF